MGDLICGRPKVEKNGIDWQPRFSTITLNAVVITIGYQSMPFNFFNEESTTVSNIDSRTFFPIVLLDVLHTYP